MKYAAWKATEINKALKEGRVPKPGGMDEDGLDGMGSGGSKGGDDGGAGLCDAMGGRGSGGSGGGAAAGGGVDSMRPAAAASGGGGLLAGGRDNEMGADRGRGGAGKASWKDDEDEKMAARYAASLPSVSSPPPSASAPHLGDADDEKAAPPAFNPSSMLPMQPQPPFPIRSSSSYLPTSYLPSTQPPPLPPQPSSRETAHAFGFSVEGGSSLASSAPYSPGFTGPALPRHSLPSPQPPQSAVPPSTQAPPPSSRYSPTPPSMITPSALPPEQGKSRSQASKDAERLLKHASSALSFDDIDTTIVKLQQAVALLYPHRTPQ